MTNIVLKRLRIIALIIAVISVSAIGSLLIYSNDVLYAQLVSFVKKNIEFGEYSAVINFNNPHYFTYNINDIKIDKNGARLTDGVTSADIILINVFKIDPDSQIIGFAENAIKDRDSAIGYQISTDYKRWYYYNGQKWQLVGDCKTCANNAITVNQNIKKFPVSSDGFQVKVFLQSNTGNLVLNSINLTIKGREFFKADNLQQARAIFARKAYADEDSVKWDRSSIEVKAKCEEPNAVFTIYNTGDFGEGDMQGLSEYRIYRNNQIEESGTFQLNGGQSMDIVVVAGCDRIRLEADQRPGHPDSSKPREIIENCGCSSPEEPFCGNNIIEEGEECEVDEDCNDGYYCQQCSCQINVMEPFCGNNIIEYGEECEVDEDCNDGYYCQQCSCQINAIEPFCGNNILEEGEECDGLGGPVLPQWCSVECKIIAGCGNGILESGEQCDDGNNENGDGCSGQCLAEQDIYCGNNIFEEGEECDGFGGPVLPQWCSAECEIIAGCGNGILESGEQCDDGNNISGDGCSIDCKLEDPYFNLAVCYLGEQGHLPEYAKFGYLARDLLQNTEVERNTVTNNGDLPQGIILGQNSSRIWSTNNYQLNSNNYVWTVKIAGKQKTATIDTYGGHEPGFYDSMRCPSQCGNGVLEPGEECDDGNNTSGDGCSSSCLWEWDLSEVIVDGDCVGSGAVFTITNNGEPLIGDMVLERQYRIYRNNILEKRGMFFLEGGERVIIDGSVYNGLDNIGGDVIRFEADQSLGYPGEHNNPAYAVVVCSLPGINAIDDYSSTTISASPLQINLLANDFYNGICANDNKISCSGNSDCYSVGGICTSNNPPINPAQVSISLISSPLHGAITIDPQTGIGSYEQPNSCITDSFVYKICDIENPFICDTAIVTIVVSGCSSSGNIVMAREYCGDGVINGTEQCEGDNDCFADQICRSCQCVSPFILRPVSYCGDGIIDSGEECDDGNNQNGDGCSADCLLESSPLRVSPLAILELVTPLSACGNGVIESALGETCDDGNTISGDGCSASCRVEFCGDGIIQPRLGETCDDGNTISGDGCSSTCQAEVFGSVAGLACIDYSIRDAAGNLTSAIAPYYNGATNTLDGFPIKGIVTVPTGASLTALRYSINGGASYRIVPQAAVQPIFSIIVDPPFKVGSHYNILVEATFSNGSIAVSAPCPISFARGCLVFEGNQFTLGAQPSPLSVDGYVQFISGEVQNFYVGSLCNDYALIRNLQDGQEFVLSPSPANPQTGNSLHLWQTNNIFFINNAELPIFYDLELEIGNRWGDIYRRIINSVVVIP